MRPVPLAEMFLMWLEFVIAALALVGGSSTLAWLGTRRQLKRLHVERTDLANSSQVIEEERRMLDLMAKGASIREVLDSLTLAIERVSPGALASILLLDEEHRRFLLKGSGPSLPEEYLQAINGLEIGLDVGACGSAAFRNETVVVEDIGTDSRFATARDFILRYGLRSCWSVPVRDSKGMVLGTFAIYHRYPTRPRAEELRMSRAAAQLAGNAIERVRAEQALRETSQRLHLAERVARFGIWEADFDKGVISVSEVMAAMMGLHATSGRVSTDEVLSSIYPEDVGALREAVRAASRRGETIQNEFRVVLPAGGVRWMRSLWRFDRDAAAEGSGPVRALGALIDITEERDILARLENARAVAEASATAAQEASRLEQERQTILELVAKDQPLDQIFLVMASAVARHLPGSFCSIQIDLPDSSRISAGSRLLPAPLNSALGRLPILAIQETMLPQSIGKLSADAAWQSCMAEVCGTPVVKYRAVSIFRDSRLSGMIVSFFEDGPDSAKTDIEKDSVLESWGQFARLAVERRSLYEQLSFRAQYDALTSLLNRASLYERLDAQIARCTREGSSMAVIYLDLDYFKEINDRLGHSAGDLVLQNVARQIRSSVRHMDVAARIGGDEFVVILPGVGDRSEASRIGDLIVAAIVRTSSFAGVELNPGASFGISIFPRDGRDTDMMLSKADEDMYRAKVKRQGNGRVRRNAVPLAIASPTLAPV